MQPTTSIDDPVSSSLLATVGDRCAGCDAPMAADQRYCTECGERRGRPRLPFMDGRARPANAPVATVPPRRARMSSSTALIAGVCTLLLAMGVGVLIGQSGGDPQPAANTPAVQVVSVPAAAAAPSAATGAAAGAGAGAGAGTAAAKASKSGTAGAATTAKTPSSGTAKPAATKHKAPPKVVKVGDKCSGGAGCTNGKFTGDFFGGG